MTQNQDELIFLPLGGVGEIGMNLAMYGFGPEESRRWIVVDVGVTFPGPDLPGADLVLPDIRYAIAEKANIEAIVITHAHEDHYGALLDLWPRLKVPVYATPFTAGMLEAKRKGDRYSNDLPLTVFRSGETFNIGPFSIQAIGVTHSIPEPVALAISTPAGRVIHTGDWKIDPSPSLGDPTDEETLRAVGETGVDALVCDSTNAVRDGISPSESEVGNSLTKLIRNAPARVAVTTFSSNVGRLRTIARAARDADRQVLVLGRSMRRVIDVATELGYLDGLPAFLDEDEFDQIPREEAVILCTGSQGESRAALAKLARGEMRNVSLDPGDTVIYSSRVIPGNEKAILSVKNNLIERGIKIIEDDDALVHVSGHPRKNELMQIYDWVKPRVSVPVHGEAAHLVAHAAIAHEAGVPEIASIRNGDVLKIAPGPATIIDQAPFGRIYKDGDIIGDEQETGIKERRKLSFVGHVAVSIVLDRRNELADEPEVICYGTPEQDNSGEFMEDLVFDAVIGAVQSIPKSRRGDIDLVREAARRAARSAAKSAWGKKPVASVLITKL